MMMNDREMKAAESLARTHTRCSGNQLTTVGRMRTMNDREMKAAQTQAMTHIRFSHWLMKVRRMVMRMDDTEMKAAATRQGHTHASAID